MEGRPQLYSSNFVAASLQSHVPGGLLRCLHCSSTPLGHGNDVCGCQASLKSAKGCCHLWLLWDMHFISSSMAWSAKQIPPKFKTASCLQCLPRQPTGPGSLSLIFICHRKLVQLLACDFVILGVYFCIFSRSTGK